MFLGDEFGTVNSGAFFLPLIKQQLFKKTTALQLSIMPNVYLAGVANLVSLIFSRLAIVNPPKPPKFVLLFKY